MIKIKNNVELHQLEKFGFKRVEGTYEFYEYCGTWCVGLSRVITPLKEVGSRDLDMLYDLIKADIVIKEELK